MDPRCESGYTTRRASEGNPALFNPSLLLMIKKTKGRIEMYNVTVYQTESGNWKWKLSFRKNALARSDRSYESAAHAKRSFTKIHRNLISAYRAPAIEIEPA